MTHQDYVSRAKSPQKKRNPYKKEAPTPTGIPARLKIIALVVIVAIAGFGYFLWSIKDIKPETTTVTQPTKQNQHESKLPKPPEEKWQYMEELKSKEVEVGQYQVEEKGPYKMQCGSFKTRKQAEVMKATIAFSGLSSQISSAQGSNGTWYKVYLGPYKRKREAEKDKHKLKSNGITTCQIWLWN